MSITRVRYRERQRLTASDLRAEQDYRLGLAGLHHLGPHDWGVVRGLHVLQIEGAQFQLTRGVAIDGHGRELLVAAPIDFTIPGYASDQCWHVAIYYCEDGAQSRERECQDVPAPRIRSRVALQVTRDFFAPDAPADYPTARAAGPLGDALPWPVLLARIGFGCRDPGPPANLIDLSLVRYLRHRAARLRTPTGNAEMRLGLSGMQDAYQFLLSTRSGNGVLARRIGVDRDGVTHVWRPLVITGAEALGQAMLGHKVQLNIRMPMPAGLGQTLRIEGLVDAELRNITASLQRFGPTLGASTPSLSATGGLQKHTAPLLFPGFQLAEVSVANANVLGAPRVFDFSAARRRFRPDVTRLMAAAAEAGEAAPPPPAIAFSMRLWATGGELYPHNVVQFRPAASLDADPLLREIHSVVTSAPADSVPKTELRIAGGEADASDASGRVSFGGRSTADDYVAALRMDGRGGLRMLAGPGVTKPSKLLAVEGATYLPAIGKNDPMLPDLLTLAHMCGLVQIGNVIANPQLELAKNTTDDGHYNLGIKRVGSEFTIKRALELIYGDESAGPADMSVRVLENLTVPNSNNSTTVNRIQVPGLAPPGRKIRIAVLMLVEVDSKTRVAVGKAIGIEIP